MSSSEGVLRGHGPLWRVRQKPRAFPLQKTRAGRRMPGFRLQRDGSRVGAPPSHAPVLTPLLGDVAAVALAGQTLQEQSAQLGDFPGSLLKSFGALGERGT